jgi:arginase
MDIDLIGVPIDFGAGRRGVDMGPSAIRYAGLRAALAELGHAVLDRGNVEVPVYETCQQGDPLLRYLDPIVDVNRRLASAVAGSVQGGHFPLVLGGDHSLALGSISGAARGRRLGVIWIDAHGDFNTPQTTPSGNIHGMPLAALAGLGDPRLVGLGEAPRQHVDPTNMVVVGARQIDPGERENLRAAGVCVFAMEQIDRMGLYRAMREAIIVASRDTEGIYLSFDLDSMDPVYAPGVGTPIQGGLTYREAHMCCEMVAETGRMVGMDLVEVNPVLDVVNKTAELAVELALSALGKRVWRD